MSPQLIRLKADGLLKMHNNVWFLPKYADDQTEDETPPDKSEGVSNGVGDTSLGREVSGKEATQTPDRDPG